MKFLKDNDVDLIFLDIHLPKISGIDFLKILPYRPHVILTTAFSEYALEGYELNVVDYLLKPFSFQRFVQAVNKVPGNQKGNTKQDTDIETANARNEVFIKSGHEYIRLNVKDLLFIKSDADYTEIFIDKKKYLSSEPLKFWVDYLDELQFVRIHKSYIVNTSMISKVSGNRVFMVSGEELPVGRAFKDEFVKRFLK